MLKKPDNKSLITLTMMFLIGIAMIFIPLIQQRVDIPPTERAKAYQMKLEA